MPEVSVAAGGRVFRAFGHIAHKANQNALLNTLLGINGYNGTILWQRPLARRVHDPSQYDDRHARDPVPGRRRVVQADRRPDRPTRRPDRRSAPGWPTGRYGSGWPSPAAGCTPWWGARRSGRPRKPSAVPGMGHWPWGMWEGHDYKDPKTNFGFGRTFVAIDAESRKILWSHREDEYVDARGVCMRGRRIYFYSPGKLLGCLDAASGKLLWKNDDRELLDAIGRDGPRPTLDHRLRHRHVPQVYRSRTCFSPGRNAAGWSRPRPKTASSSGSGSPATCNSCSATMRSMAPASSKPADSNWPTPRAKRWPSCPPGGPAPARRAPSTASFSAPAAGPCGSIWPAARPSTSRRCARPARTA